MLAYAKLAIQSQLEYRFNALADWCVNPMMSTIVELAMWWTLFQAMGVSTLGGFTREYYLSYVTWAVFFARITANWMYEFRMLQEVESGSINAILVRPTNFYEFYLGQFLGYKLCSALFSLWMPALFALMMGGTTDFLRLPFSLLLAVLYLFFTFTLSFCLVTFAFKLNKIGSFTVTKNFFIWLASGELFPLDLLPEKIKFVNQFLPFSAACYIPVGFLTQRIGWNELLISMTSVVVWTLLLGVLASYLWKRGLKNYSGTGA